MKFVIIFIILFLPGCATPDLLPIRNVNKINNVVSLGVPITKPDLIYPSHFLKIGQEGWVELKVDISKNGKVHNVRVVDYSPHKDFVESAVKTANGLTYKAPVIAGEEVDLKNHTIRVDFLIEQ